MDKQISLSYLSDELAQVRTKKKEFLTRIEQILPWGEWETMIQPYYYKGERGNKPCGLDLMLHLYILQNLYDLSDEATRVEVIDSLQYGIQDCSRGGAYHNKRFRDAAEQRDLHISYDSRIG